MKNKMIHVLAIPTVYILWMYVFQWAELGFWILDYKPYVYRALVPLLSKVVMLAGLSQHESLLFILTLVCIANVFVIHKFYSLWVDGDRCWAFTYISIWGLALLLEVDPTFYDMMTILLLTLCLYFMFRNEPIKLFIAFVFLCVNRETAFFVTLIWAMWYWRKIKIEYWMYMIASQVFVFVFIQSIIRSGFQSIERNDQYLRLFENIAVWAHNPMSTLFLVLGLLLVIWMSLYNRSSKPPFLVQSFCILLPIQFILFALYGSEYQLRVFAEVYPITFLLISYNIKGVTHEIEKSKEYPKPLPKVQDYGQVNSSQ